MILVKTLIMFSPEKATPVKECALRRVPFVPTTKPLYEMLNLFQEGRGPAPPGLARLIRPGQGGGREMHMRFFCVFFVISTNLHFLWFFAFFSVDVHPRCTFLLQIEPCFYTFCYTFPCNEHPPPRRRQQAATWRL